MIILVRYVIPVLIFSKYRYHGPFHFPFPNGAKNASKEIRIPNFIFDCLQFRPYLCNYPAADPCPIYHDMVYRVQSILF